MCSHEEEQVIATGMWPGWAFPGVALPCKDALWKWIAIRYKDKLTFAQVRDVGPWTIDDSEYVFGDALPRAEIYKGSLCPRIRGNPLSCAKVSGVPIPKSNGAGIDLFPYTASQLGIPKDENVPVEWMFIYADMLR